MIKEIDIAHMLQEHDVKLLKQNQEEIFNLKSKVKRKFDSGLSKAEAQEAQGLMEALAVLENTYTEIRDKW